MVARTDGGKIIQLETTVYGGNGDQGLCKRVGRNEKRIDDLEAWRDESRGQRKLLWGILATVLAGVILQIISNFPR